jgi:antirestriction protein
MLDICIQNLGKYTEGELIYKWISLPVDEEEFRAALKEIEIDGEEYEEFFIADYEEFLGYQVGEYENFETLNNLAEEIISLKEYEIEALEAIIESESNDLENALEILQSGDYQFYPNLETLEELAEIMIDEGFFGDIPENLVNYIDYEKLGRDLSYDGYVLTSKGVIYIY